MYKVSEKEKEALKMPLGKVYLNIGEILRLLKGRQIVSIGDICTLTLIDNGIIPHLAVFDFIYMRKELPKEKQVQLENTFADMKIYKNEPGTISDKFAKDAKKLLKEGGAVKIDGEEDLTAIPLILNADEKMGIVYGQPNEGIVLVIPDNKTKKRIKKILIAFAHA